MAYTTVNKSTDYFNTKTYTGTGSNLAITGVGHQPSLTWIKQIGATTAHNLVDAVRGVSKALASNDTSGQGDYSPNNLKSFDSDGFTLGTGSLVNTSSGTYVSWNWKANGQGSVNTDGSTDSLYTSASPTSGFSIVTYTGNGANRTIGHGLGVAPSMIITKQYNGTRSWYVGATSIGWGSELYLDSTAASAGSPSTFNSTAPTSSVFSIGSGSAANSNGETFIAYCFADIQGFSQVGKQYIGNADTNNGVFVYTGFKPAWVMIKGETSGRDWVIIDNKRGAFNIFGERLYANDNHAGDTSGDYFSFLSNGFQVQENVNLFNANNESYTYIAFAEAPLVGSNNVPATAR